MIGKDPRAEEAHSTERYQTTDEFAPFTTGIGQPPNHDHADGAAHIRDSREQANHHRALRAGAADQLWRPEIQAIGGDLDQEVDQRESQEARNAQRCQQ
ncbi:hypothetical protein D3C71_1752470 [compost metagenome]